MDIGLEALKRASATDRMLTRPEFFRLSLPADRESLRELLKRQPTVKVHDELLSQLAELVRAQEPTVNFSKPDLAAAAVARLDGRAADDYGVWVYYPWSGRLVHLLDEHEFALVRTDRNRNKITREEQERLSKLRIGVIGLSVGQSICITLALERGFGELRIADFDTLDLSNLNRIRSGVHSLGHLKTVNVAREIAELDPYLKVTLFNEGLTRENIDRFLDEGGKLDILVDECDSVDVKILCRQRAKAYRIPVIMDTSDRGMLDIERFDLEPERPILHGLIDHLDPEVAAKAKTNEEKLPFVLPIAGSHALSPRMKASMLEIGSTVTTWPQLASSVVMGGAVGAEFCRRIGLGQSRASGRWYVEPETITGEGIETPQKVSEPTGDHPPALNLDLMMRSVDAIGDTPLSAGFSKEEVLALAEAGALAPSAGNSQPWSFLHSGGRLFVFLDAARGTSRLDAGGLLPAIGLGACIENVRLTAESLGIRPIIRTFPLSYADELVAVIEPGERGVPQAAGGLADQIPMRCSNRKKPLDRPVDRAVFEELAEAARNIPGCAAHFTSGPGQLMELAEAISLAERLRVLNPIGHDELFGHEMRWTRDEAVATRDGLDLETMELSASEQVAFRMAADPVTIGLLREWNGGSGFQKMTRGAVQRSAAVCLISALGEGPEDLLNAGRAVQRMWLAATKHGLAVHPVSAPLLLAHHIRSGGGTGLSATERTLLLEAYGTVARVFAPDQRIPVFMVRLAHAEPPSARSLRRPLGELLHSHHPVTA